MLCTTPTTPLYMVYEHRTFQKCRLLSSEFSNKLLQINLNWNSISNIDININLLITIWLFSHLQGDGFKDNKRDSSEGKFYVKLVLSIERNIQLKCLWEVLLEVDAAFLGLQF